MGGSGKGVSLVEDNDGGGIVESGRRTSAKREQKDGKESDGEKSDWRERERVVRVSETIRR